MRIYSINNTFAAVGFKLRLASDYLLAICWLSAAHRLQWTKMHVAYVSRTRVANIDRRTLQQAPLRHTTATHNSLCHP